MFKENKEFWFYVFGTIVLFVIIMFGMRNYFGNRSFASLFYYQTIPTRTVSISTDGPEQVAKSEFDYFAVIKTSEGEIEVDLLEESAPNTVNNFIYLAEQDFYNGTKFHRLIPGILLQGGSPNTLNEDPNDDRFGGPGYVIDDEINWDSLDYRKDLRNELTRAGYKSTPRLKSEPIDKYTLAMANAGPDTNGSQFFFVLADKSTQEIRELRGRHTVFATVFSNPELIDKFAEWSVDNPLDENPRPSPVISILDIEIIAREN